MDLWDRNTPFWHVLHLYPMFYEKKTTNNPIGNDYTWENIFNRWPLNLLPRVFFFYWKHISKVDILIFILWIRNHKIYLSILVNNFRQCTGYVKFLLSCILWSSNNNFGDKSEMHGNDDDIDDDINISIKENGILLLSTLCFIWLNCEIYIHYLLHRTKPGAWHFALLIMFIHNKNENW